MQLLCGWVLSLSIYLSSHLPSLSLFPSHHQTVGWVSVLTDRRDFQPCGFSVRLLDAVIGCWGSQATQGSQGNNYNFFFFFFFTATLTHFFFQLSVFLIYLFLHILVGLKLMLKSICNMYVHMCVHKLQPSQPQTKCKQKYVSFPHTHRIKVHSGIFWVRWVHLDWHQLSVGKISLYVYPTTSKICTPRLARFGVCVGECVCEWRWLSEYLGQPLRLFTCQEGVWLHFSLSGRACFSTCATVSFCFVPFLAPFLLVFLLL